MEIILLGHMGRDDALADRLEGHKLHVIGQWANPGLLDKTVASSGTYSLVENITDVEVIADAVQGIEPDMFLTNFDDALGAGVVNSIRRRVNEKRMPELLLPCPDQQASRIEWDKFYLRDIIEHVDPKYNPINFMVSTEEQVNLAVSFFEEENMEIVVKPRNLTGGKGVKVMGKHFESFKQGRDYALQVLDADNQEGVEVQEKLVGHEFTLQIFTDGKTIIKPPTTHDYPYREDGNLGPGTGGMGDFSMEDGLMPFLTEADYDEAIDITEKILEALKEQNIDYKGVIYPSFFKTDDGLKMVEVNARGGDPELINIIDLIEDDIELAEVLKQIALGELEPNSVRYKKLASAMIYLVSPDYAYRKGPAYEFGMDSSAATANNSRIRFAASERITGSRYRTVGSSRSVGISSNGATPWEARENILKTIEEAFEKPLDLDFRSEVGEEDYVDCLQ